MLRSCTQLVKGLTCRPSARCRLDAVRSRGVVDRISLVPFSNASVTTDCALPNDSWSPDMLEQFNKFMEMTRDGTWKRLPSYRKFMEKVTLGGKEYVLKRAPNSRFFMRSIDKEGLGFEYVMFLNQAQKRLVCLFQPGIYLEGPPGFAHGGSTAAILDSTLGGCAFYMAGRIMTGNLNINYKSPIPLGSVVLVESKLDRVEGRKVFMTGHIRSADGQTLHAEATGKSLFVLSQP
uniref:Acyl-coenzyme A thioesterase THEM4 n=1 Tax=Salvator merianae TaxID=96440 RepID=A0A8D0KN00_SALMN